MDSIWFRRLSIIRTRSSNWTDREGFWQHVYSSPLAPIRSSQAGKVPRNDVVRQHARCRGSAMSPVTINPGTRLGPYEIVSRNAKRRPSRSSTIRTSARFTTSATTIW